MKKRIISYISIIAVMFGAIPAVAQAASPTLCPGGQVCLFDHKNYGGLLGYRRAGTGLQNISSPNNDKMSSWSNKTGTNAAWYQNKNGGGKCYTMPAYTSSSYVGIVANDTASSWRTNRGC